MKDSLTRRAFLQKAAALSAAFTILPHSRILGANDDVRVAVVGVGNKGSQHVGMFKNLPGVRVTALCDVDSNRVAEALEKHFKEPGTQPKTYTDVRKLLEDKEVDAVCVATPNHWHALVTVWACEAGKDVYVEKPASHTLWEGQQMIAAAKKHSRIVQVGTQSRSDAGLQGARQYIRDGNIGEVSYIRGVYYSLREPLPKVTGPQTPPAGVDYNLWLGPAPDEPLTRKNLHYDWHWDWDYGNGELGNNGVHMVDLAAWFLDIKEFPTRVVSLGGRFGFDDDAETPNTQTVFYDYKPVPVVCELRNLPASKGLSYADDLNGLRVGIEVKGREGYYLAYNTGGYIYDNKGKRVKQFKGDGGGSHQQNFIDAVRSRKVENVATNIEAGHLSAGLAHLGNISHKLGKPADGATIAKAVAGVSPMEGIVGEFNEHLLVNGVDVQKNPRVLGPWLTFDPAAQRFTGDQEVAANALMTTTYRPGFEIPNQG